MKRAILPLCAFLAMAGSAPASDMGPWERMYGAPGAYGVHHPPPTVVIDHHEPVAPPTVVRRTYRRTVIEVTEEVRRPVLAPDPRMFWGPGY